MYVKLPIIMLVNGKGFSIRQIRRNGYTLENLGSKEGPPWLEILHEPLLVD